MMQIGKEGSDMSQAEAKQRIARLVAALDQLRPSQIGWIEAVVAQLQRATAFSRWEKSDLVTPCVLDDFGDALRIHHCVPLAVSRTRPRA